MNNLVKKEVFIGNCRLILGDCLDVMSTLDKVDFVLTDPPYGTTACKWDTVIPLDVMWNKLCSIIKNNGAIGIFSNQPFTTNLIYTNREMFKYCWYWKKTKPNGWQHSKNKPMTAIEEICIFSKSSMGHSSLLGNNRMVYNPQGVVDSTSKIITACKHGRTMGARPKQVGKIYQSQTGFPSNILEYKNIIGKTAEHPTQKPTDLLEYLIKTYSCEHETVLDFTMGSGSTGVACVNTNRKFIGIELNEEYFNIACRRIENTYRNKKDLLI